MKDTRPFPMLMSYEERERFPECPRSVPWGLLASHEEQAKVNHDQDLAKLARRGGLDPCEMVCILRDVRWKTMGLGWDRIPDDKIRECIDEIKRRVSEWEAAT